MTIEWEDGRWIELVFEHEVVVGRRFAVSFGRASDADLERSISGTHWAIASQPLLASILPKDNQVTLGPISGLATPVGQSQGTSPLFAEALQVGTIHVQFSLRPSTGGNYRASVPVSIVAGGPKPEPKPEPKPVPQPEPEPKPEPKPQTDIVGRLDSIILNLSMIVEELNDIVEDLDDL